MAEAEGGRSDLGIKPSEDQHRGEHDGGGTVAADRAPRGPTALVSLGAAAVPLRSVGVESARDQVRSEFSLTFRFLMHSCTSIFGVVKPDLPIRMSDLSKFQRAGDLMCIKRERRVGFPSLQMPHTAEIKWRK